MPEWAVVLVVMTVYWMGGMWTVRWSAENQFGGRPSPTDLIAMVMLWPVWWAAHISWREGWKKR